MRRGRRLGGPIASTTQAKAGSRRTSSSVISCWVFGLVGMVAPRVGGDQGPAGLVAGYGREPYAGTPKLHGPSAPPRAARSLARAGHEPAVVVGRGDPRP